MKNDLSAVGLAKKNLKNKPGRTTGLIILTAIMCFILFMSSFVILSLKNGMKSLSDRMGADILVVPQGYDSKISTAILRGEPNSFFLDASVMKRVAKVKGVQDVCPQFYLATLSASCCSFPIQVIGIDFEHDFTVVPWMQHQIKLPLKKGEVVVGNNVVGDVKSDVKFFNRPFKIKSRLARTGMGFDNSVFMPIEEAKSLAKEYEKVLGKPLVSNENTISSVMVKIDRDEDAKIVADRISSEFKGEMVYPLVAHKMMNEISQNVHSMLKYVYLLIALVWILAFVVLSLVYSITLRERKGEFGTLRILGATKKKLKELYLTEVLMINGWGALIGTATSLAFSLLFSTWMAQSAKLPFLKPTLPALLLTFLATVLLGILIGPLSSLMGLRKLDKTEPALLLKERD